MASNPIKDGKFNIIWLILTILIALARIEDETEGQDDGSVEELALDSIQFQKFTPELTSKIGNYCFYILENLLFL